jgi:hypothetical protein
MYFRGHHTNTSEATVQKTKSGVDSSSSSGTEEECSDGQQDLATHPLLSHPYLQRNDKRISQQTLDLMGTISRLQHENLRLVGKNQELVESIAQQVEESGDHTGKVQDSLKLELNNLVTKLTSSKRKVTPLKVCKLLLTVLLDDPDFLLREEFKKTFLHRSKQYYRQEVFTPTKVLRAMDLAGGTLSYSGIELLREVERPPLNQENNRKKRFKSILPSTASLKALARAMEKTADKYCPFEMIETESGEGYKFETKRTMQTLLSAHDLIEVAKRRNVEISESIDGTQLTKSVSTVIAGVKIIDVEAKCPVTGKLINLNPDAAGADSTSMLTQSRDRCFPMQMIIGRESKATFPIFGDLFSFMGKSSLDEENAQNNIGRVNLVSDEYKLFRLSATADLVAHQKGLNKGGGYKTKHYFCPYCPAHSHTAHHPNHVPCDTWCMNLPSRQSTGDGETTSCYHHDMSGTAKLREMEQKIDHLRQMVNNVETITERTRVKFSFTRENGEMNDKMSIHYQPTSVFNKMNFGVLLTQELDLRGLEIGGSLEEKRSRLLPCLDNENQLNQLNKVLTVATPDTAAFYLLLQAVPCILHLENRIWLKILTLLFSEGMTKRCQNRPSLILKYANDVEEIVNSKILGTEDNPAQFRFPLQEDRKTLCPLRLDNNRARAIFNQIELLIEISVPEEDRKFKWNSCSPKIRGAIEILRLRREYTPREIEEFQELIDEWFLIFLDLWGDSGLTNYIHILSSGHCAEFMTRYGCLYRYSQQGWENMNSVIKSFFFKRTNHGGKAGQGDTGGKKSKLLAIARWQQRRLMWLCGFGLSVDQNRLPEIEEQEIIPQQEPLVEIEQDDGAIDGAIDIHSMESI